jgi:hypothetical protein
MTGPWEIMNMARLPGSVMTPADRSFSSAPAGADRPAAVLSRTAGRMLTVSMVVAALLFVALTLGTSLIGRTSFYGGGILLNNAPWISDDYRPVATDNGLVGDTVDGAIPSRHEIIERLRSGDLAGWTSLQGSGTEIGSVPNFGMLAPTAAAWWVLPAPLAPGWERLTILVVAAAGMALFLRRVGVGRHASWLAGMVYAGSGFMIAWTNWPQAAVAGMAPWLLWAVERSLQRRTVSSVVPVSLSVAALLLGGFPAITGWTIYLVAAWALVRLVIDWRGQGDGRVRTAAGQIGRLGLGLVLGVGLAAVQLVVFAVGFLELDTSSRAGGFFFTQPLRLALTTLFPNTWGINGGVFYPRSNPIEGNAYFGAAAAMLCVLAVATRPHSSVQRGVRTFFAAAAALCAVLVYVQGPLVEWIGRLPVFSGNPIGRLVAIMVIALAVLAGLGADALVRPRPRADGVLQRLVPVALVGGAGLLTFLLAVFVRAQVNAHRSQDAQLAALPITLWLAFAVAGAGVVVLLVLARSWRPRLAAAAFAIVPLVVAGQGVVAAAPVWEQVAADRFYPVTQMHRYLLDHIGHDRMASTGQTMLNGTTAYYGLRSATGHLFFPQPYSDLIDRIAPAGRLTPTYWVLPDGYDPGVWQSPGLDRLAVRYLVTRSDTAIPGAATPVVIGNTPTPLSGRPVEVALPPGAVRGIEMQFLSGPSAPSAGYVVAEVIDSEGRTVASTRRLVRFPHPASALPIPIAGEGLGTEPVRLRLSWQGDTAPPTVAADAAGVPALSVIQPAADGLRLVSDDDGAVWERTTSLPRIRWADEAVVISDPTVRADAVAHDDIAPDAVVLSEPGEAISGRPAVLHVDEDSGDTVDVDVRAEGAGYLVLADSIQDDWSVQVDGTAATIEAADHAFGAVHVPAGDHRVTFTYTPRGQDLGFGISAVSLLVLLGLAAAPVVRRRVRDRQPR